MEYPWAENNIKLTHSMRIIQKNGFPLNEETAMAEYIRQGGRIVIHPVVIENGRITKQAEIVDNKTENYSDRIPELIKLYSKKDRKQH